MLPEKLPMTSTMIYAIAVTSKIDKTLYYNDKSLRQKEQTIVTGALVKVPLGKRLVTGVVISTAAASDAELEPTLKDIKLKSIHSLLPKDLWLTEELVHLLTWATRYYHQPAGKVLNTALPGALLKGGLSNLGPTLGWKVDPNKPEENIKALARAPRQKELYQWILNNPQKTSTEIRLAEFDSGLLKQLSDKGLVSAQPIEPTSRAEPLLRETPLSLTDEQSSALEKIVSPEGAERIYLLDGVTGSGKTEIYLQAAEWALKQDRQVLILVPEIGLIHQTENSFRKRLNAPVITYTSECSDTEKLNAWRAARASSPAIFIGTRSAVFLPLAIPGLFVVDEEHDLSYKQQEGFRYNARDLMTLRSRDLKTPLVLGSATPSIESQKNVHSGAYQHLTMYHRVANQPLPTMRLTTPSQTPGQTLSNESISRIHEEIQRGSQVIVFINRRGFAPRLYCGQCAWLAQCPHCDTALCKHAQPAQLICHHCDHRIALPKSCPRCQSVQLTTQGLGTEQLEKDLSTIFPMIDCIRIDRDSTSRKGSFKKHLERASDGRPCILIGTQMLAKGHHLPNLSLAVITEADQALFSHDYRAAEHLGQLVTQVAGRTGRGTETGELIIETSYPDHPLLRQLTRGDYSQFTAGIIEERKQRELPPFSHAAILRAESANLPALIEFMDLAKTTSINSASEEIEIIGPMPAAMERRKGRFRYQLNLSCSNRKSLHQTLAQLCFILNKAKTHSGLRWGIDVDPLTSD